ncbi:MAG: hypothetical protein CFE28_03125 [Alphaproteobacteria bacterium PA2]|nr:MAG: hypothetical protein CFE28_03125 [Alphaproteobacteria bacterium PA2]
MAENKTRATIASVEAYIGAFTDAERRADCEALSAMMSRATGCEAVMWGPSIVGFDLHRYPLANGKQGEICLVGFASRKGDISLYGMDSVLDQVGALGKHKTGKGCLYIRRLSDLDVGVLAGLMEKAVADRRAGDRQSC